MVMSNEQEGKAESKEWKFGGGEGWLFFKKILTLTPDL